MRIAGKLKQRILAEVGRDKPLDIALADKWTFYFLLIGIIAGLGSVVFHYLCQVGIFSSTDVRGVLFSPEIEALVLMKDIATPEIIFTAPSDDLNSVLKKFTIKNIDSLPVVAEDDRAHLLGMLNRREVIAFYNQKIEEMKRKAVD